MYVAARALGYSHLLKPTLWLSSPVGYTKRYFIYQLAILKNNNKYKTYARDLALPLLRHSQNQNIT